MSLSADRIALKQKTMNEIDIGWLEYRGYSNNSIRIAMEAETKFTLRLEPLRATLTNLISFSVEPSWRSARCYRRVRKERTVGREVCGSVFVTRTISFSVVRN